MIKIKCKNCGKLFDTYPSFLKQGIVNCSRECRKNGLTKVCEICGNKFYRKSSQIYKNNYCSKKCHNLSMKGIYKINSGSYVTGQNLGEKHPNWSGGRKSDFFGYFYLYMPEHPFSKKRYIAEHRYACECVIGRFLLPEERPHHINENKSDNRPENLFLFNSHKEHTRYHSLLRYNKISKISQSNLLKF